MATEHVPNEGDGAGMNETLGKFGHHPDEVIDAEVEVGRLQGLLAEAHGGLLRALDFRTATPEGLSIKHDVRHVLHQTGFTGPMGEVGDQQLAAAVRSGEPS